jgi:hypothetical protein
MSRQEAYQQNYAPYFIRMRTRAEARMQVKYCIVEKINESYA